MNNEEKTNFVEILRDRVANKEKSRSFEKIIELIDATAFHRGYQQGVRDSREDLVNLTK